MNNIQRQADLKTVLKFLLITFIITWISWWTLALLTSQDIILVNSILYFILFVLGGFGPTIAAILVLPSKNWKNILHFIIKQKPKTILWLLAFCLIQALIIGLSSMELNSQIPLLFLPIILLQITIYGGGNEELGWRGIMQPLLEKHFHFIPATLLTASAWMLWHVPLWFIKGSSQQNINFILYIIYGVILSFWLALLFKKTKSVLYTMIFHGFSNLMISIFILKINALLISGFVVTLAITIYIHHKSIQKDKNKLNIA